MDLTIIKEIILTPNVEKWIIHNFEILHMIQDEIPRIFLTLFVFKYQLQNTCFSALQHFPSHFPHFPIPPYQSQALLLWVLLGVLISCIADAVLCLERSSAKWCSLYRRKIINRYSRNLDNMMSSLCEPHKICTLGMGRFRS